MKTLLIVEDEKLIRQGIKTMVMRSGVPVDLIMECTNGEAALEVVKEQQIDVMFTDIRMPKMDGIELVRRIHEEVENPPEMVAISGFDDFSYAVEMMRNGVREYILKPVEREKVVEVLKKLDKEISEKESNIINERRLGIVQLRNVLLTDNVNSEEIALLIQKYESSFFGGRYHVCVMSGDCNVEERDNYFCIKEINDGNVVVIEETNLAMFLRNELPEEYVGISGSHQGLAELRKAYVEAEAARLHVFATGSQKQMYFEDMESLPKIRAELLATGEKQLEESAHMHRLQRIGTDKTEELTTLWEKFFETVKREHIRSTDFLREMEKFIEEAKGFYRNSLNDEDIEALSQLSHILKYDTLNDYEEAFLSWVMAFHERINQKDDEDKNLQKIEQALAYVAENYKNDLNMAVVSNHISMNYTMFSYCFKQYTGKNFTTYIKEVRVNEAKRLLTETDMKVIDISWEVGYENEKNFMKVFKSVCGVSPSEYRKNVLRG